MFWRATRAAGEAEEGLVYSPKHVRGCGHWRRGEGQLAGLAPNDTAAPSDTAAGHAIVENDPPWSW